MFRCGECQLAALASTPLFTLPQDPVAFAKQRPTETREDARDRLQHAVVRRITQEQWGLGCSLGIPRPETEQEKAREKFGEDCSIFEEVSANLWSQHVDVTPINHSVDPFIGCSRHVSSLSNVAHVRALSHRSPGPTSPNPGAECLIDFKRRRRVASPFASLLVCAQRSLPRTISSSVLVSLQPPPHLNSHNDSK